MDIKKSKLNFQYNLFKQNIVYAFCIFYNILQILHKLYFVRTLQDYYNISDRFRNILAILQYFQGIFLQYIL